MLNSINLIPAMQLLRSQISHASNLATGTLSTFRSRLLTDDELTDILALTFANEAANALFNVCINGLILSEKSALERIRLYLFTEDCGHYVIDNSKSIISSLNHMTGYSWIRRRGRYPHCAVNGLSSLPRRATHVPRSIRTGQGCDSTSYYTALCVDPIGRPYTRVFFCLFIVDSSKFQ